MTASDGVPKADGEVADQLLLLGDLNMRLARAMRSGGPGGQVHRVRQIGR